MKRSLHYVFQRSFSLELRKEHLSVLNHLCQQLKEAWARLESWVISSHVLEIFSDKTHIETTKPKNVTDNKFLTLLILLPYIYRV